MTFPPESSSSSPCLMAGGAKVTECYLSETSDDESGDEFGPSYVKLASLATKQQRALEKVQYMLNKSDDMLGEEMDQSKLWLKVFRDFILSMTPFKIIITLSYLIMRSFLMNFFKESKILRS